jgi:hypothetical protein
LAGHSEGLTGDGIDKRRVDSRRQNLRQNARRDALEKKTCVTGCCGNKPRAADRAASKLEFIWKNPNYTGCILKKILMLALNGKLV